MAHDNTLTLFIKGDMRQLKDVTLDEIRLQLSPMIMNWRTVMQIAGSILEQGCWSDSRGRYPVTSVRAMVHDIDQLNLIENSPRGEFKEMGLEGAGVSYDFHKTCL